MTKRKIFTTQNIARMAIFTTLAYVLYLPVFEFSLIPAVPFLKIDFSNAFVLMAGFALGPVPALVVCILKELLHALTFSTTIGIGELANVLMALPLVLIPSCVYKRHRNFKAVCISLAVGCAAQTVWSVLVNYTLTFPFFLIAYAGASSWSAGMEFYLSVWYWAVLFNFVKALLLSAAVLLLYKNFQRLFALMFRENGRKKKKTDVKEGSDYAITEESAPEGRSEQAPEEIVSEEPISATEGEKEEAEGSEESSPMSENDEQKEI